MSPLTNEVKARCRNFRKEPTVAENILWRHLRDRRMGGAKFRRQHPVGPYTLDFYCKEVQLGIELDGSGHLDPEQAQYDQERTNTLMATESASSVIGIPISSRISTPFSTKY
jgi:very-short-patch-repair endonuclease